MGVQELVKAYRKAGFLPFPLKPMSKDPAVKSLSWAESVKFSTENNIGLFTGSPNKLVVVDADEPSARVFVENRLEAIGLLEWTTVVRTPKRKSSHFWLRVNGVPQYAQAYYKLPKEIGGGEIRIHRPAYVVAPGSVIAEGEYTFIQGGIEFFNTQPLLDYEDLKWLLPEHALYAPATRRTQGSGDVLDAKTYGLEFAYREYPPIIKLFSLLNRGKGYRVNKVDMRTGEILEDTYPSRSEAEQALVMGLIRAGWTFEKIEERFKEEKPGHYIETPNPQAYLEKAYEKAARFIAGRRSNAGGGQAVH